MKYIDGLREVSHLSTQLTVADLERMLDEWKSEPIPEPLTLDEWIEIAPTSERRKKLLRKIIQEAMK